MKPRSERYKRYVAALRGFIRSEVGRILNRLVETRAPAEIVIERLNFRNPALSRRLNRILSKFGKNEVARKLKDLNQRFGIEITEVNPAYSSQEHDCGYVDTRNRQRQAHFHCRWCNSTRHADVNAAQNLLRRRSDAAIGDPRRPKQAILSELVRRFAERYHRPLARSPDPRLSNPYFKDWKATVMSSAFGLNPTSDCK
jgi:putative transposase